MLTVKNDATDAAAVKPLTPHIADEEYFLADLIAGLLAAIRTRLDKKPFRLITKIDGTLPRVLRGDKNHICRALLNLLLNAVQHTDEGSVTLAMHGEKAARQGGENIPLTFVIQDAGGAAGDEQVFAQLNGAADLAGEAAQWCRLMGGSLTAKNVRGQGSVFTVVIPQRIIDGAPFAFVNESATKRVIVYEARRQYVESLVYTLNNLGVACSTAHSPNELIAQLSAATDFVFVSLAFVEEVSAILAQENTRAHLVGLGYPGEERVEGAHLLYLPLHPLDAADILNGKPPRASAHAFAGDHDAALKQTAALKSASVMQKQGV